MSEELTREEQEEITTVIATLLSVSTEKTVLDLRGLVLQMKASGMSNKDIKQVLINDLRSGGRIFGTYKNAVKNTVGASISYASRLSSKKVFEEANVEQYRWESISIKEGKKPCPDCEKRHGETGSWDFFKLIGMPQSGFSICQSHCRCQLVPIDYKEKI